MLVSFGYLTKKSLLFLGVPIVMFLQLFLTDLTTNKSKNMFYSGFLQFLGRSLHGILWLIFGRIIVPNKKEKQNNEEMTSQGQLIELHDNGFILNEDKIIKNNSINRMRESINQQKRKIEIKNHHKKILLLILVCILDFLSVTLYTVVVETNYYKYRSCSQVFIIITSKLFVMAILSHFIIKKTTKMYSHQILSIKVISIAVLFVIFYSPTVDPTKNERFFPKLGILLLPELLYSFMYVCGAKYLSITKGNVYKFLFINGIIGIILSILLQFISNFFIDCNLIKEKKFFYDKNAPYCDNENKLKTLKIIIENININEFFIIILNILVTFFEEWLIWLLIFKFSINHFGAIHTIPLLLTFLIDFNNFKPKNYIVRCLDSVMIIIMAFVYNEIIILRFCGYDKNTAIEINKRSITETSCDFEEDEEEIFEKTNDNYLILKEDIGLVNEMDN